jgi:hypothetical protein
VAEPEGGESGGDGPGGDQDDLLPVLLDQHVDECVDPVGVEPAGRGGQRGRADLDDDPAGFADVLPCRCHCTPLRAVAGAGVAVVAGLALAVGFSTTVFACPDRCP